MSSFTFYEFFAGGGMARVGLGPNWTCLAANDIDIKKTKVYAQNFGSHGLHQQDIRTLSASSLPSHADLAWASFPCQDLSVAAKGAGINGTRSSVLDHFIRLIAELRSDGRAPKILVLENVPNLLTSSKGSDFRQVCTDLVAHGYKFGPLLIDAKHFLPQSRERLFIVALREDLPQPTHLLGTGLEHSMPKRLWNALDSLPANMRSEHLRWALPNSTRPFSCNLASLLEPDHSAHWCSATKTDRLLGLMSPDHREEVTFREKSGSRFVGAVFRRTRTVDGLKQQRAEVRFDGLAGCLRTAKGGSSRQELLVIDEGHTRSRLVSGREMARLMGLPDNYKLSASDTQAANLLGDGVVVPVVRNLAEHLLEPILRSV